MTSGRLSVAVVGAGPAGLYATEQLLRYQGGAVSVDVIDRLPTPWGLIRGGVAPDHPEKKQIVDRLFSFVLNDERVRFIGNVEIGKTISLEEISACYDAVIVAPGASGNGRLGILGEDLPGSWQANDFVGFYNGHPDQSDLPFDLTGDRAVIVGNGNVALDLARILMTPPAELRKTDIADHAIDALMQSNIREVVLLGRRGPMDGAFHNPELEELAHLTDVDIEVTGAIVPDETDAELAGAEWHVRRKMKTLRNLAGRPRREAGRKIVFRFWSSPLAFEGNGRVERLLLADTFPAISANEAIHRPLHESTLDTGFVLRAIGYRGASVPGLPYDERLSVITNVAGRVMTNDGPMAGVYVAGWAKRGCRGVIGSNRICSAETVANLLEDWEEGKLLPPISSANSALEAIAQKHPLVSGSGWRRINHAELAAGRAEGRPRRKITNRDDLISCAATGRT
ncbi:FAD-dependent oxidoreductase [Novosphingobium colocasiae]|uniref:NADPH-ferredoxin reductase FprA n=1 Tax=Novosphingobium colocasiae TaxID=1256513 RepID=A0A918UKX6_9SPHN|nr:FAD-dependent oxidoreductase [Novosphingobium colocasiae]GGZ17187.1 NADPH-ferredoxin reductase FprA [Novosphingobium colocasiae]